MSENHPPHTGQPWSCPPVSLFRSQRLRSMRTANEARRLSLSSEASVGHSHPLPHIMLKYPPHAAQNDFIKNSSLISIKNYYFLFKHLYIHYKTIHILFNMDFLRRAQLPILQQTAQTTFILTGESPVDILLLFHHIVTPPFNGMIPLRQRGSLYNRRHIIPFFTICFFLVSQVFPVIA